MTPLACRVALTLGLSVVGLGGTGLAAQTPTVLDPTNADSSAGNQGTVKIFHLGPYNIPAARMIGTNLVPGEYQPGLGVPVQNPGNWWMTGYDNRIVDLNRVAVDQTYPEGGSDFYLHHAVFVNTAVRDLTCALFPGERFAASGGERIPMALPNGYGYQIRAGDPLRCVLHMQNFTLQPKQVYLQYSMTLQPTSANYTAVRPWWLDVVFCTSTYNVPSGTGLDVRERTYTAPQNLSLLTMTPHLHCGGSQLDFINKTTGQSLWSFSNNPNACPVSMQAVLPSPAMAIPAGTQVTIRATYPRHPTKTLDAMGILMTFVVLQ